MFTNVSQTPRKQDFAYIRQLTVDEVISEYVVISVEKVAQLPYFLKILTAKAKRPDMSTARVKMDNGRTGVSC